MNPIFTIGHSTHPMEEFVEILRAHSVRLLADVRSIPRSRRNPQFNREALEVSLPGEGIAYRHMPGLGGRRHARRDSINTAWRNESFRGYADYMQTPDFDRNLRDLIEASGEQQTAIMCAEAVPWRCHRTLIGDALSARGIPVEDILSASSRKPHKVTPFAQIDGANVVYPGL